MIESMLENVFPIKILEHCDFPKISKTPEIFFLELKSIRNFTFYLLFGEFFGKIRFWRNSSMQKLDTIEHCRRNGTSGESQRVLFAGKVVCCSLLRSTSSQQVLNIWTSNKRQQLNLFEITKLVKSETGNFLSNTDAAFFSGPKKI